MITKTETRLENQKQRTSKNYTLGMSLRNKRKNLSYWK